MTCFKKYTETTHPDYDLIKLAKKAGLTDIRIEWHGAHSYHMHMRGWCLHSNETYLRGYDKAKLKELIKLYQLSK